MWGKSGDSAVMVWWSERGLTERRLGGLVADRKFVLFSSLFVYYFQCPPRQRSLFVRSSEWKMRRIILAS